MEEKKKKTQKTQKKKSRFNFLNQVPLVERIFFVQNLEIMVRTGFSLADALKTLSLQTKHKRFHQVILELQQHVEGGDSFSSGLKKYPAIFSELFVSMIEAGEISGKLDKTLKQLTIQMKKSHTLYAKIRNALTYPAIIFLALVGIGTAMMIFVVPKILTMYEGTEYSLPLPTKIVLGASTFIINNGILTAVVCIALIIAFAIFVTNEKGKTIFHRILLKTPIAGKIIIKINIAKMARVLNSLITTDIPIVKSFEMISKILGNRIYRQHLLASSKKLQKGESIFNIFKEKPDLFPPVVGQMIQVGEESGSLDVITKEIAEFYEEEVENTMANLTVIIEPVIMLIVGAGVGLIAIAIVWPIYGLVNQI